MATFFRTETNVFYLNDVEVPAPSPQPEVTHHVFVVDRSGSMSGDIAGLKSTIEQVLATESLLKENVETTLISFSSAGDVKLHWSHVPANAVTELSNPYLAELRSIRATYLTGISQALNMALDQVKGDQTTGITLFTDGYANDPSSSEENKALDAFVKRGMKFPNVFVNTIGYRDWCDWPRMDKIANAMSGKCVKASSFKTVLGVMKDTQALLAGRVRPAIKVPAHAEMMIMAVNRTSGQVNATPVAEPLVLRGVGSDEQVMIFNVAKGDSTYNLPKGVKVVQPQDAWMLAAVAKAYMSMGAIRTAKEILFASGNKTLWEEHQSAMTPSTLASLNEALSEWVRAGNNVGYAMGHNVRPKHNLFDLADAINSLPPRSIGIDLEAFGTSYRRRSIKKVFGTRADDGSLIPPNAVTVPREGARVYIRGISFNRSDASVQLETEQAVWIQRHSDGKIIQEVDFVSLETLRDNKSYTIVSSGERNVEVVPLEVYTKDAFTALEPYVQGSADFTPGMKVNVPMRRFRMEAEGVPSVETLMDTMKTLRRAEAEVKLLSAMQDKAAASPYTPSQIESLKALHLSPALNCSPPSTTHYVDREEAVRKGEIDAFTRYLVNFGTPTFFSSGDFRSGNAFLDRFFKVSLNGAEVKKPKLDTYLQGAKYTIKNDPGTSDATADEVMMTVARELLLAPERLKNEQITERLAVAKKKVESCYDAFQGLVMEIGCTGLIPEELEAQATRYEPEAFAAKYEIKLGKAEAEGVYWVFDSCGLMISVTPETSWYTVA